MKLVSWNVNGLRAVVNKGFADIFTSFDADYFALQEIKLQAGQIDLCFPGYGSSWSYAQRKGYSGTAVFWKHSPLSEAVCMGIDRHDAEGRITMVENENFYLVNVYTPNAQDMLARLDYRLDWEDSFMDFLKDLDRHKPVVVCGYLNVAHNEIDLANPAANRKSPGFSDQERQAFGRLLDAGFVDTFRALHPHQEKAYSWWSYRGGARARNVGWRIDYFLISERLRPRLTSATIHSGILGSDHCPVEITLDF